MKIGSVDKLLEECGCTCLLEKEALELQEACRLTKAEMHQDEMSENE